MSPFDAYRFMIALKTHFSRESYDFFEKCGRISANKVSFEKRNDKHRIADLANSLQDFELRDYFLANLINNLSWTPFDINSKTRYLQFKGYKAARKHHFESEVKKLYEKENIFCTIDGNCVILNAYLGGDISLDTFVIVDMIHPFIDDLCYDVVKKSLCQTARKYRPFVKVKIEEYEELEKKILLNMS